MIRIRVILIRSNMFFSQANTLVVKAPELIPVFPVYASD